MTARDSSASTTEQLHSDALESILQIDIETELALIYLSLDRVDESIEQAVRALRIVDDLDNEGIGVTTPAVADLAEVFRFCGALDVALGLAHRAYSALGSDADRTARSRQATLVADCAIESAWQLSRTAADDPTAEASLEDVISIALNAAEDFRSAVDPSDNLTYRWITGECALLSGDLDRSLKIIEPIVNADEYQGDPILARVHHLAATIALRQGNPTEAIDRFNSVNEAFANDPLREDRLLRERSTAYGEVEDFASAARHALLAAERADARHVGAIGALSRQFLQRHEVEHPQLAVVAPIVEVDGSHLDELTGVASRASFDERLTLRGKGIGDVSILLLEVDQPAATGRVDDDVLVKVGQLLLRSCREGDLVARSDQNQFAVLPSEGNLVKAHALGERIRKAVDSETWESQDGEVDITVSVGASAGPAKLAPDVLEASELALRDARLAGCNCVVAHRLGRTVLPTRTPENDRESTG